MKKNLLIVLLTFTSLAFSQEISFQKEKDRLTYFHQNETISRPDVKKLLYKNPKASKLWQKADLKKRGGIILITAGSIVTIDGLHRKSSPNQPCWNQIGSGVSFAVLGLLITKGIKQKRAKAIEEYNSALKIEFDHQGIILLW